MKTLICTALAFSLLGSTASFARRGDHDHRGNNGGEHRDNDRDGDRDNDRGNRDDYRDRGDDRNQGRPHWSRGDHLPPHFRQRDYVVSDWRERHLRTPPRGYQWIRNDDDQYVLAAIATGIIAEIVAQSLFRPDYRWSSGERLTGGYLEKRYVVTDWRANRLRAPGRGQHWVRVDDQYLLTNARNGVILEIAVR